MMARGTNINCRADAEHPDGCAKSCNAFRWMGPVGGRSRARVRLQLVVGALHALPGLGDLFLRVGPGVSSGIA